MQLLIISFFHSLLQVQTSAATGTSTDYFPIAIQLIFAIGFVSVMLLGSNFLGPKRKTNDKLENFASGIETHGTARQPMAIKYFLVAILFVLFDVEVIFFYPYAVNFKALGWHGFGEVVLFVAFFLIGFYYIIKKGALTWKTEHEWLFYKKQGFVFICIGTPFSLLFCSKNRSWVAIPKTKSSISFHSANF